MEFARVYDVQLQAREKLLTWVRPLSQAQYTQAFPFGMRSVRGSLVEIARAEFFLSHRLLEEPLPPTGEWPFSEAKQPTLADLEPVWAAQSAEIRAALARTTDWDREVTARLVRESGPVRLTATKGDIAVQILLHDVHHRAQAMAMLRQLGVDAQNLDYIRFTQRAEPDPR
ncbi:MAG TPA: DinB family protein [bacterium]|nr:DinB family protein [bacterium]